MIRLDVWLYGPHARHADENNRGSYANLQLEMPAGTRMRDLLQRLGMPLEEKAITFVNGDLTDTPGLLADLDRELLDGDRVAFLHQLSMWPFQYRFGAATGSELKDKLQQRDDAGIYHSSTLSERTEVE